MTSYNDDDKVGPWAEEKLSCLEKYLSEYAKILGKQLWCSGYYYVDAFAGRGISEVRSKDTADDQTDMLALAGYRPNSEDEKQYVRGSAIRALNLAHPFKGYLFIDNDPERIERLENIRESHERKDLIRIKPGDANEVLIESIINNPQIDWNKQRAVVFLDPFGMQVPWSTVEALASTKGIEVIINLPVGTTLQRLLPKNGEFSIKQREKLDEYFGTSDWWDVLYHQSKTLFGEKIEKVENSGEKLAIWYAGRLKKIFGEVASPRLITNPSGGHLYYLIFAGPNKTGAKIADHIMKQGKAVRLP